MDKIQISLLIVIVGILITGGYYLQKTFLGNTDLVGEVPLEELEEGLDEKENVEIGPEKIFILQEATVISVGEKDIIVEPSEMQGLSQKYFSQSVKILIAKDTEIKKLTLKEFTVFQEEMQNYVESQDKDKVAPSQYIKSIILLSEIEPGNIVTIEANEDIKNKDSFTASKIQAIIRNY